jgi:hypothetical protein
MSWDAIILRIDGPLRPAAQVAESEYRPLGRPAAVAAAVRAAFPAAEWESPTHARGCLDDYTAISFDLQEVAGYSFVSVSVSGSADPIPSLLGLVRANGWVLLDVQTSEFIDPANPARDGWLGYRSLVDRIGRGDTCAGRPPGPGHRTNKRRRRPGTG